MQGAKAWLGLGGGLALGAVIFAGCGGDDGAGACAAGATSLTFLDPVDGATITMTDDVDPGMALLQYDFHARACGVDPASQVGVYLLMPTETGYAFTTAGDGNLIFPAVTLIPGALEFQLRTTDGMVQSTSITIQVTP